MTMPENLTTDKPIWIVAGAGISCAPPASIPVWGKIKTDTLNSAVSILAHTVNKWGGFSHELVDEIDSVRDTLLEFPEEAMEDLCMAFGEEPTTGMLASVLEGSTPAKPLPTVAHRRIARLVCEQRVVGIITSNFDTLFESALSSIDADFQVLLSGATPYYPVPIPLFKVHGSVDAPSTMSFRRSTYYAGFPETFVSYLKEAVRNSHVVILGYSGYDSDLFPLIYDILGNRAARNTATLINPNRPAENSPLGSLLKLSNVKHVNCTADEFFCGENSSTAGSVKDASVIPSKDIEPVVTFLGLASRRTQPLTAHNLFWLLQDIADDSGDMFWRAVAHFGKSLCASDTQDLSDECLMGCSFLERLRKANILFSQQCQMFFNWVVCSMWQLTRHILAVGMKSGVLRIGPNMRKLTTVWEAIENEFQDWSPTVEGSASWGFSNAVIGLLHAIMGYHRQPRYAIPGILEIINSARRSGNYELELGAIELLNSCSKTSNRHQFDFSARYESIREIVNASKCRKSLSQIDAKDFKMQMLMSM
jgi:hypothetical protein